MSNHKMKGLLKGLRYISQIFENEKEAEMQIGFPTDVKHVAHIGWDGPSVNSPSWMSEYKAAPGFQSQPLGPPGEVNEESEIQWVSEDSTRRRNQNPPEKDLPELPKSSRRHASTGSATENASGEKAEKTRSRRSSKTNKEGSESTKSRNHKATSQEGEPSSKLPDIPKKSRRKKSKESVDGGSSRSSRSSRRAQASKSDSLLEESESVSKGNDNEQELAETPALDSSERKEDNGFTEIP